MLLTADYAASIRIITTTAIIVQFDGTVVGVNIFLKKIYNCALVFFSIWFNYWAYKIMAAFVLLRLDNLLKAFKSKLR